MLKNKVVSLSRIIDKTILALHFEKLKNDTQFIENEYADYFGFDYTVTNNWEKEFFEIIVAGEVVGLVWLDYIRRSNTGSIHLVVFPEQRNLGYGKNAKWLLSEYALETMSFNCIRSNVYAYNEIMLKYNRRFLTETGYSRDAVLYKNKYWNMYMFSMNQSEFFKFKKDNPEFFIE